MTARIRDFLRNRRDDGPCLVVDLDVVRDNYLTFAKALPDTRVFYAVKANPAPEVLSLLAGLGSCFDTASVAEIEMALAAGAAAGPHLLRQHHQEGARHRARLRARRAALRRRLRGRGREDRPRRARRRVFCRILSDCVGAEWPLSRKFGCEPAMAVDVLEHAHRLGLEAYGVSFHVGSQQRNPHAWDRALASAAAVFRDCGERGIDAVDGQPRRRLPDQVPQGRADGEDLWPAIFRALRKHFGNRIPETIIEPGRGMVGNAGVIEAEVVLVSKKSENDDVRWVYLDIGKFGGLAETMDESIRYPIRTPRDGDTRRPACSPARPAIRPTCCTRRSPIDAAGQPRDRRQGADRRHRGLYGDLLVGRLQRLRAAEDVPHLIALSRQSIAGSRHGRLSSSILLEQKSPLTTPLRERGGRGGERSGHGHDPH